MLKLLKRKSVLIALAVVVGLGIISATFVFGVNAYVVASTEGRIISIEEVAGLDGVDCIIVLGCKVRDDGSLSDMLRDRVETGIEVYYSMTESGNGTKLLMSGDHGTVEYNEVYAMKQYAIAEGIDSEEIFMDHAGFSTYESICRAKEVFGADRIVIVTQEYHLYRALHIADALGVEAYGVSADLNAYGGQTMRDLREILARNKDFLSGVLKPDPTYLGEPISLAGSGDVTNDY